MPGFKEGCSGVLVVNKPKGMISKDVSRALSRRYNECRKIGHVGTLDPLAEGLLILLIGQATKLQDIFLHRPKRYEFDVQFGTSTRTLDTEGEVSETCSFDHIDRPKIEEVLPQFLGSVQQTPPLYSAVKLRGKPLYRYAREKSGVHIDLDSLKREVHIKSLELKGFSEGRASFSVHCSKGTYVRILGADIARSLGTCGHLTKILRKACSGFGFCDGVDVADLLSDESTLGDHLIPLEDGRLGLDQVVIGRTVDYEKLCNGTSVSLNLSDQALSGKIDNFLARDTTGVIFLDSCKKAFAIGQLVRDSKCSTSAVAKITRRLR